MITPKLLPFAAIAAMLAGCAPAPAPAPVAPPPVAVAPVAPLPTAGIAGLEERQPDLCGAKAYVPSLGQPGSVIASLGITDEYRVVEYRGIEPQEYNPQRIVFRLDSSGNIYNIDCG